MGYGYDGAGFAVGVCLETNETVKANAFLIGCTRTWRMHATTTAINARRRGPSFGESAGFLSGVVLRILTVFPWFVVLLLSSWCLPSPTGGLATFVRPPPLLFLPGAQECP